MEDVLHGIGWAALVLTVIIGALAGWIASKVAGGNRARYIVTGIIAAVAVPVVLGLLGLSLLAAGGLVAVALVALIGAAIVLVIAKLVFD
ncbi:GlsB/YeaQ/YmgE family stress response membrane protein [Falsirhodobacter deserti]|uniref:GlsB/YeaQ/YmgE family stress response membrane protein n=1 Tax=Falsirhodobacter deserti TaxID=1365611 RepID=UPI000FE385D9|nr:GlsB/YeaQ/YmgE family stress response membrane protein [Falsirhodobacter deserti]